jgi:type I restriction enzyme S subunit
MGDRRRTLNPDALFACEIPLPTIDEQQQVVEHIESLAEQINDARLLRQKAAKEAAVLWKQGASRVFVRAEVKYPLRPLAECVSIKGGGTPSKANPLYWLGTIPWVTPKDMKVREINDSIDHISEDAITESSAKRIEPGAVLIVVRGMILLHTVPTAILRVPAAINQDMKALIPKPDLLPEYLSALFWALNDRILALVEKSTHDTRKLETPVLLATKITVPPLDEQRRIVTELDALHAEVDALKRLQAETSAELDALLPAILDRAFKGEL